MHRADVRGAAVGCPAPDAQPTEGTVTSIQTLRWSEVGNPPTSPQSAKLKTPEPERRIRLKWPEHAGIHELERLSRQDVVGPQVPRRGVGEVGGVEPRVASVRRVRASLQRGRLHRPRTRRGQLPVHERVLDQLLDRPGMLSPSSGSDSGHRRSRRARPASGRPGVRRRRRCTRPAGRDVVGPEADLVEVPPAVTVLGPVEHRGRRMRDEEWTVFPRSGSGRPSGSSTRAGGCPPRRASRTGRDQGSGMSFH